MIDINNVLIAISVVSVPLVSAITVHEWSHAFVANLRGDRSAKMLGRLSLNPIKHIDPVGTILVPITLLILQTNMLFGWAKPVPVNEYALKNPRWDMALVAVAGPVSNVIMAAIWGIINTSINPSNSISAWLYQSSIAGVVINIFLAVLNMMPILPLDGGRILSAFLPRKYVYYYDQTEPYGFWVLIILLVTGIISIIVSPAVNTAMAVLDRLH